MVVGPPELGVEDDAEGPVRGGRVNDLGGRRGVVVSPSSMAPHKAAASPCFSTDSTMLPYSTHLPVPSSFVDDAAYLGTGNSTKDAHDTIRNMMERSGGAFEWPKSHNSPFELSKLIILINFPRPNSNDPEANLSISLTKPMPMARRCSCRR